MKVHVISDMEGVAGIVKWEQTTGGDPMYEEGRRLYTEEINAAVRGAKAAGATEIVVMDCHGAGKGWSFNSLIPDLLDPACEYVVQQEWTEYTEFLEQGCDAALFVGMHARAGTRDGVMNHTVSGQSWQNLSFNGTLVGETGINAALCGNWNCPVLLVTGDEAVCREGRELLGEGLKTVAVKRGLGAVQRASAACPARPRADRGGSEGRARGARCRPAVRPGLTVHDRGRVHADGRARRVHAQARRRAHRRADDHVVSYNVVGSVAAVLSGVATLVVVLSGAAWQPREELPVPRTEVAAAPFRGDIAVVGGYLADRSSTDEVDLYDPASDSWSRLPDLPVGVNHAAAASAGGKLYVVGGYGGPGVRLRSAYVFDGERWRTLAPMPGVRGAAGAAVVAGRLYVVGGVGPNGLPAAPSHST